MKRYYSSITIVIFLLFTKSSFANDVYEITVYHFKDAQQEIMLDTYLQTAYLPALHRQNKNTLACLNQLKTILQPIK